MLCLFLAAVASVALGQNPGFQVALTNKGLEYAREVALPILIKELETIAIPDINGDADTPVGHVSYSLSQIHVTGVNIPTSSIVANTAGIAVSLSGVSISMNAHWHYREDSFPHISDSGSCDMSASSVSCSVTVGVGVSPTHEPTVNTESCNANIGHLDITFHGGASWLYNLFSSLIADAVKSSLNSQLCSIIKQEINVEGNQILATLPVQEKVDQYAAINFELLAPPTLPGDYVQTHHKGEFFSIAHPAESPFTPVPLPIPGAGTLPRMLYVWMSSYLLESAGWGYEQVGVLNYTITPDKVPASFPLKLNTSSFRDLIPALFAKYPNMLMEATIAAVGNPLTVTISESGMMAAGTCTVAFAVINPDKTIVPDVFIISVTVFASGKAWVVGSGATNSVVANLTLVNVTMTLASSTIGPINLNPLQFALNIFTSMFLLPAVNKELNKGFVIPVIEGLTFVNPQLSYGPGYLVVDTDISYKPSLENLTPSPILFDTMQ